MRIIVLICLLFLMNLGSYAQEDTVSHHNAVIWRGCNHRWTYNHRIKRFGDYVSYQNGSNPIVIDPHGFHYSASGIGKDSTYFNSYYTCVSTKDAVFTEVTQKMKIRGVLKHLTGGTKTCTFHLESWMKNKMAYVTLLNGFDMTSEDPADKIQVLKISVGDGIYDSEKNDLTFQIAANLVFDCQSAECTGGDELDYQVEIYVLIVGFDRDRASISQNQILSSCSWNIRKELHTESIPKIVTGCLSPYFPCATIGIKSFGITLNEGLHLLQLNAHIDSPVFISEDNHQMSINGDYFFKQWRKGMKWTPAARLASLFSFRQSGYEIFDMNLVALQFQNAEIRYYQYSDSMYWPGKESTSVTDPRGEKDFKLSNLPSWEKDIGKVNR